MRNVWLAVVAVVMSLGSMTPLAAGIFGFGGGHCCDPCTQCRVNPCACAPAVTQAVPVVRPQTVMQSQTIMQPHTVSVPQTVYRDVARTEYRTQAEMQQVPVTRYRAVAVDEGGWQQVWVPRVVQKQVPETVMEQRTVYRSVPYQVTQRIPETTYTTQTQWVPRVVQTPVTVGTTQSPCMPHTSTPSLGWNSYSAPLAAMPAQTYVQPPMIGTIPSATGSFPTPVATQADPFSPQPLRTAVNAPDTNLNPVPDPKFLDTPHASEWSPVRASPKQPMPVRTSSTNNLFVPVPAGKTATRIR